MSRRLFIGSLYAGRQYDGLEFNGVAVTVDRRDGAKKKRRPLPLIFQPPSPQSLQAERQRREVEEHVGNIWSRAFAEAIRPRPPSAHATKRIVVSDAQVLELLASPKWDEQEEELLLFGEELGLDAEVLL